MHLSSYKRPVRIEGDMTDTVGYRLRVFDVETGEEIENITKAVITLIPAQYPIVEFTYWEVHEGPRSYMTEETMRIDSPDVRLTARERERER